MNMSCYEFPLHKCRKDREIYIKKIKNKFQLGKSYLCPANSSIYCRGK